MLYSTIKSKNTNEDPKTSSIIGALLLLPDSLMVEVLRLACEPGNMPVDIGRINGFEFWPHWYDDTYNSIYVEPDVVIYGEHKDILIEAKYSDSNGQYADQWTKEIEAYHNVFQSKKDIIFISLGGNQDYGKETIKDTVIYKCSWTSLLLAVISTRAKVYESGIDNDTINHLCRIFDHLILSFSIHGIYTCSPLDSTTLNATIIDGTCNFFETVNYNII